MVFTATGFSVALNKQGGGELSRSVILASQELADKTDRIAVDPRDVKAAMDAKTDKFVGFEQRDAHEFISDLVDNIHEELQDKDKQTEPGGTDANDSGDVQMEMANDNALPTDDFRLTVDVCLKCNSCGYTR
jgi:ubiquitin C-terminal hydrolase